MKKGIIALLGFTFVFTGVAASTNYDSINAWVGAMNTNPVNTPPKDLAAGGHNLGFTERKKTFTDNGVWYQWTEPSDKDYDWMIFAFDKITVTTATLNWQIGIDHDSNKVHVLYWHDDNNQWVWLDENEGGRNPATNHTNVKTAYDNSDEIVIFLFVGYTPAAADNWIKCDVADVDAN